MNRLFALAEDFFNPEMLRKKVIGFLGAGNMAEALVRGLIESRKVGPGQIIASDRFSERLVHMAETYEVKVFNKNYEVARRADVIFIAVKPRDVPGLLREVGPDVERGKLLITVAAGLTVDTITGLMGRHIPVIRAMPNTPVIVREGVTALFAGPGVEARELKIASSVFEAVGEVVLIRDESLMDAVTGLSGSGPAYLFLVMDAMVKAGVELGIPEADSRLLALRTALGAARLAIESRKGLDELVDMVSSPGGTTIEGLKKLRGSGVEDAFREAIRAAARRSKELSGRK